MKHGNSEARLTRKALCARRGSGVWRQRIIAGGESAPSVIDRPTVAVSFHSSPNWHGSPSALMEDGGGIALSGFSGEATGTEGWPDGMDGAPDHGSRRSSDGASTVGA